MRKIIVTFMMMLCVACVASAANYLTFTAEEDSSTFAIVNDNNNPDVQYSLDGGETWTALTEEYSVLIAHKGDKALLRGNNPEGFSKGYKKYSSFTMSGKIAASGSVMSLIDGVGDITIIPNLSDYSLVYLFSGCTSLTQAPELPATTLGGYCYESMFSGCTSLTQAPELPATTVAEGCYYWMFRGCTSLTQAPSLPVTTLADYCYYNMFSGCTSLTQAPKLPATTLADYCYYNMFSGCTSLTQAPELSATTLVGYCCYEMFSGCTSLSQIHVSFDNWSHATCQWVKNVAPTGTFVCPKDLPLEYGVDRIPEGWMVKYVDEGSGVSSTLADGITVWTDDLTVYVRGAEGEVSLYDVSGKRVAVSVSADEERALSVPAKGVYVVRTNNGTSDVLVR